MHRLHWFAFAYHGAFLLFMGIMSFVVYTAYQRRSGSTGMDVAKIYQTRHEAFLNKETSSKELTQKDPK